MPEKIPYPAKDLNTKTWPDFEKLFAKHNGIWGGCWRMFYHTTGTFQTKAHGPANKRAKKELVSMGRAHGIIVYRQAKPVGWCQYGARKELPRIDSSSKYPKPVLGEENKLWRITCFFVDRHNRRRGLGRFALNATLDAIKRKGVD